MPQRVRVLRQKSGTILFRIRNLHLLEYILDPRGVHGRTVRLGNQTVEYQAKGWKKWQAAYGIIRIYIYIYHGILCIDT